MKREESIIRKDTPSAVSNHSENLSKLSNSKLQPFVSNHPSKMSNLSNFQSVAVRRPVQGLRRTPGGVSGPVSVGFHRSAFDEALLAEYFVPVSWIDTVPFADEAFSEAGLFGNQNTVCKPTTSKWRHTIERLKERFPKWRDELQQS